MWKYHRALSSLLLKQMTSNRKPAGLYIHIPFCKTKCPYCDFYSITDQTAKDRFLTALKREIALYRTAFPRFDSLYFGGGTPSVINEEAFTDIFTALRVSFSFLPDTEITVEMNPDDVTTEKLECYRTLGVNRISLGVQSLNNAELAFLKRRHTAEGARKALRLIWKQGFKNFAIDLMNSFPGQTEKQWSATLKEALSYRPTHVSCYQLTVADHTVFGEMAREGKFTLPSEQKQKKIFFSTSRFLQEQGFIHYEVSNFAHGRKFRSRHNLKYWCHTPYLGLGPAAHSFHDNRRWWNVRSVDQYCTSLENNKKPVEETEYLSPEQLGMEKLLLGMRNLEGTAISEITDIPFCKDQLKKLVSKKIVQLQSGKIVPTIRGYLIADRLPLLLLR